MSASDTTVGYPPHAVAEYRTQTNPNGVTIIDWTAACGATGQKVGEPAHVFSRSGSARRTELCPSCYPTGHQDNHPAPKRVST